jgi:OOP family OmpA-OmpF porin
MKYPVLRCAVAALLLAGAPLAHAEGDYWYTGLGVGYSRVQFYPADFSSGGTAVDRKKDFDAGFRGFLGYQINRYLAAEISYATLGNFQYRYTRAGVTQRDDYKVTGFGFGLAPTLPLTRNFSLYGRLGGFFSQTRLTIANVGSVPGINSSTLQTSETSLLSSFGMQYFFGGDNGFRIEYENLGKVGNPCPLGTPSAPACVGRANAKMLSVNAIFKF